MEEAIYKQEKVVLIVYVLNCVMQKVLENQNNTNKIVLRQFNTILSETDRQMKTEVSRKIDILFKTM